MGSNIEFYYEKKIIGLLFAYYRKKSTFTLNDILRNEKHYCTDCLLNIECKPKEKICTSATLYKIEKGIPAKNDCIYYQLCQKLEKTVDFNELISKRMNQIRDRLYECIISNSKKDTKQLLALVTKLLNEYNDVIYYSERLTFYHDMLNYQLEGTLPNKKNVEMYLYLVKMEIDTVEKKLLLLFLFRLKFIFEDIISISEILNQIEYFIDCKIMFEVKLYNITEEITIKNYLTLNEIHECNLSSYFTYLLNDNKAYLLLNTGGLNQAIDLLKENLSLIEKNDFCDLTKINCFRKTGIILYSKKDYSEAIDCFNRVIDFSFDKLGTNFLLLFNALENENRLIEIPQFLNTIDINSIENKQVKAIIRYYSKKYENSFIDKKTMSELEDYICNDMIDLLSYGQFYRTILLDDLKEYVSKTLNYKKLLVFENA